MHRWLDASKGAPRGVHSQGSDSPSLLKVLLSQPSLCCGRSSAPLGTIGACVWVALCLSRMEGLSMAGASHQCWAEGTRLDKPWPLGSEPGNSLCWTSPSSCWVPGSSTPHPLSPLCVISKRTEAAQPHGPAPLQRWWVGLDLALALDTAWAWPLTGLCSTGPYAQGLPAHSFQWSSLSPGSISSACPSGWYQRFNKNLYWSQGKWQLLPFPHPSPVCRSGYLSQCLVTA